MPSVALLPACALLAGVCAGVASSQPIAHGATLVVGIASTAVAAWLVRHGAVALTLALAGYVVAGATLGGHAAAQALAPSIRAMLEHEVGGFTLAALGPPRPHEPFTIRARLVEDASPVEFGASMHVDLEAIEIAGVMRRVEGGLRLAVGGAAAVGKVGEWRAGRVIEAPVTFRRPARYLNDGVPDVERELALDGVALNASAKSALLIDVVRRGHAFEEASATVRAHVRTRIARYVGGHDSLSAAIVTAILIGDRTGLPDEIRQRLQAAGTYHVIAISGGNIAILAALIAAVFFVAGATGRGSAMAIICALLAYASLVHAGPSVWRATAMAVAYLAARVIDHRSPPWNALAVSALLLGCVAPLDVRAVGFALTFGATAAILEAARRVRGVTRDSGSVNDKRSWRRWVVASVAASAAAEVVLLPIGASTFSRVTFAGLILNLLAVPLMSIAQVAGLMVVAAGELEWVASASGLIAAGAAWLLVESARLVDVLPWLAIRVPAPSPLVIVTYYVALASTVWAPVAPRAKAGSAAVTTFCGLLILTGAAPAVRPDAARTQLRLTVFDVGQGDAVLLQMPGGRAVMVDTGGAGFDGQAFDIGSRVLAPALWARGVGSLDLLALTHGDPDHIGGAAALIRDFSPRAVWEGIPVARHRPLQDVLTLARDKGAHVTAQWTGGRLDLEGVSIRVLHPQPPDWERQRVRNDDSLVLDVRHGEVAMLLTGDISADIERAILPRLTPARVRVLKVAHHGSRTSTSQELLDAWKPHVAVISCGRGNRFGHPAPEVMRRLAASGVRVYRTDRDGQITIETDGTSLKVRTFIGEKE